MLDTRPHPTDPSLNRRPSARRLLLYGALLSTVVLVAAAAAMQDILLAAGVAALLLAGAGVWWIRHATDGVALLSAFLVLLFVLPASYSIVGLRSVGAPSFVFAAGLGVWWLYQRLWRRHPVQRGNRPLHVLIALLVIVWLVSYALAHRTAVSGAELRSMDRTLLLVAGWAGILLTAADGTPSLERLNRLGRRIVYFTSYVAFVAILQSRQVADLAQFDLPGLAVSGENSGAYDIRSGFERVRSTTLHPIELAAVLGISFPLALHYLVHSRDTRERRIMLLCVGLLVVALPMTVTRTGVVTLAVALAILIPAWPPRWRRRFLLWSIPSILALRVALPGLLGTLRSLFTAGSDDPSIAGRQEDYPLVFDMIARNPWFGIGPGRFTPEEFFYLDNQFLGTTLELGAVGAVVVIALFLTGPIMATRAGQVSESREVALLARSLTAGVVAGFATFFTFDTLGFPVISSLLFLYLGMIAALYRLTCEAASSATRPHEVSVRSGVG